MGLVDTARGDGLCLIRGLCAAGLRLNVFQRDSELAVPEGATYEMLLKVRKWDVNHE